LIYERLNVLRLCRGRAGPRRVELREEALRRAVDHGENAAATTIAAG
jgi:hypothetical protein